MTQPKQCDSADSATLQRNIFTITSLTALVSQTVPRAPNINCSTTEFAVFMRTIFMLARFKILQDTLERMLL